jgi:hypothetical protein
MDVSFILSLYNGWNSSSLKQREEDINMGKRIAKAPCGMCYLCERGRKCANPMVSDEHAPKDHREHSEKHDHDIFRDMGMQSLERATGFAS